MERMPFVSLEPCLKENRYLSFITLLPLTSFPCYAFVVAQLTKMELIETILPSVS